jgi:hypothetical protein
LPCLVFRHLEAQAGGLVLLVIVQQVLLRLSEFLLAGDQWGNLSEVFARIFRS